MTSTNDSPALTRAIPVLASTDLDATQEFYGQRLRFDVVATYDDYAVLGNALRFQERISA